MLGTCPCSAVLGHPWMSFSMFTLMPKRLRYSGWTEMPECSRYPSSSGSLLKSGHLLSTQLKPSLPVGQASLPCKIEVRKVMPITFQ